jgi:hypothetical protein
VVALAEQYASLMDDEMSPFTGDEWEHDHSSTKYTPSPCCSPRLFGYICTVYGRGYMYVQYRRHHVPH